MFTSVRVVCANTLGFAVQEGEVGKARQYIKVPHSAVFDPSAIKAELGLANHSWVKFIERTEQLATRKVTDKEAVNWLIKVFGDAEKPVEEQDNASARTMKKVLELFQGTGMGSDMRSANKTAWGLVNSVTEYMDHHRGTRTVDSRLDKAWFGDGALTKTKAWNAASDLLAA